MGHLMEVAVAIFIQGATFILTIAILVTAAIMIAKRYSLHAFLRKNSEIIVLLLLQKLNLACSELGNTRVNDRFRILAHPFKMEQNSREM